MKNRGLNISLSIVYSFLLFLFWSCQEEPITDHKEEMHDHESGLIHLSKMQFEALSIRVDTLAFRNLNAFVETNGKLTLPPQSEASVTAIIGANITDIKVIEGDKIKKGEVLAYISHPELFKLQSEYIRKVNELDYLEKEYSRQEALYNEKINSGREFQKVKSEYRSLQADTKGLRYTLKLLNINPDHLKEGKIYNSVSITSPISGHIRAVNVRTGQYVQAQDELFKIVNNDHIHAHFLVYENDIQKVKIGQKVIFKIASMEDLEYEAVIFSVGKVFESEPKAVEIHAEIENTKGQLISGMYCKGRIITENIQRQALPAEAVIREGDKNYIFSAVRKDSEWEFRPIEIIPGIESNAWVEIKPMQKIDPTTAFAYNQAYYLMSEWKKEDAGHDH